MLGPYAFKIPEYPQFFYITALEITAKFATRLGFSSDATYYTGLAQSARALYQKTWYNAATGCYGAVAAGMAEPCTYVSQIMALTLGLVPAGSAQEAAVWAHAMGMHFSIYAPLYLSLFVDFSIRFFLVIFFFFFEM